MCPRCLLALFRKTKGKANYRLKQFGLFGALTGVDVLLLSRPRVLKPHLGDPLAQPRHRRDALQILAVGVAVDLEVGLQHLQLLLGERRPHAFRLAFVVSFGVASIFIRQRANIYCKENLLFLVFMIYRRLRSCLPRSSPGSGPCTAPGRRAAQTVRRSTTGGRRSRRRSTPSGRPARAPAAPSPTTKCRGSTWNTSLRSF